MQDDSVHNVVSPWPHRWALVLACATFPLVWVGGLVTTTDAGMAVPDWPSTYGYNLFLYPWKTWLFGPWDLFVEHGHRLLAATVGLLTIFLLAALWRCDQRRWVRQLGGVALFLVIAQGVLGGMRVLLDERLLAMFHGCVGPLFFALTVSLVVVTSQAWRGTGVSACENLKTRSQKFDSRLLHQLGTVRSLVVLTCLLVFVQLGLGALLRHMPVGAKPSTFATVAQFHVGLALLLAFDVGVLLWLAVACLRRVPLLRNLALVLALLTAIQLGLGVGTWAVKYSIARWVSNIPWLASYTIKAGSWLQTHVVTAHVAVGSLMLATSVALALYTLRWVPITERKKVSKAVGALGVAL